MHSSLKFKNKSILIVDDNGINRLVPGLILRPFGWTVHEADGGLLAIRMLHEWEYSCILLDISMPVISGVEVLNHLRKNSNFVDLKVIAYTAYAQIEDYSLFLNLGFDAVLIKPLTSEKLLEILKN